MPNILALVNGLYVFHFLFEEDIQVVEECFWVHGKRSLVLSIWNVHFDPRTAKIEKRHIWVVLPCFPLFCWNIKRFRVVSISIGKFIHIED